MALFLTNDDVRRLLPMGECVTVLEELFMQESRGSVENLPRQRFRFGKAGATIMGGTVLEAQAHAVRHSTATLLYNTETGRLDAVLEPGTLAWIRTGAASGVAVKHMSAPDASVVGMIGTGRQAITQIEAICAVRPVKTVKVFSRDAGKRESFAAEMATRLGVSVVPVATTEECIRGSQIVIAITSAREPVFDGALLEPGTCVVAAGSNSWMKREVDDTTIQRSALVVVDNLEQAQIECGELIWAVERGTFRWRQARELHQVVSGEVKGRPSADAITLFESQGIGIEDAAASAYVLQKARAAGIGLELPF
ncbi:MAG: ornithine cyclodeaminase family protein [Planctomycetota bacterium]|nr:MAG: ornithine cyclodeaminase family protein [Planctomycetota bacterium]